MAHIELLVEEPSAEAALRHLIPRVVRRPETTYAVYVHQGKADLLARLPARLRGYAKWLPPDHRVCVLLDEDRRDCHELKHRLMAIAGAAGMGSKVLSRIAVEELEAWFFGDLEAIAQAYPRVSPRLGLKAAYRDPDAIPGGTWERLERELQRAGYFATGLRKIEAANAIARYMDPARNRSRSFRTFSAGIRRLEDLG